MVHQNMIRNTEIWLLTRTAVTVLAMFMLVLQPSFAQQIRQSQLSESQQKRVADEQIAGQFYQRQEWGKAAEYYRQLYQDYPLQYYYQYYLNCLFELRDYATAEKTIKQYARKNQADFQTDIDLGYVYQLSGDSRKAEKTFNAVIYALPKDQNRVLMTANAFRNRSLFDYAMKVYEKASHEPGAENAYLMEMATIYQLLGNYDEMFDKYLDYAINNPIQLVLVKSRVQNLLMVDIEGGLADLFRTKILSRAQANPSNEIYGELLVWFALQQKDFELAMRQLQAIDRRLGDRDNEVLELAEICLSNSEYDIALDGYNYLVKKGPNGMFYAGGLTGQLKARYLIAQQTAVSERAEYAKLNTDINKAVDIIGFNRETMDVMLTQTQLLAFKLGQIHDALTLIEKLINLPLNDVELAQIKMQQADILLFDNNVWEATLLYSQVEKSLKDAPLAHEARFRNARLRFFIGEFSWAQASLDILKSATSKLIANDAMALSLLIRDNLFEDTTGASLKVFAHASLLVFQHNDKLALHLLDSLSNTKKAAGIGDHILMEQASIFQQQGDFQTCDSLLEQLVQRYPEGYLADDALFKRAQLNEDVLKNETEAQTLYEYLFTHYPASIYVAEARRKFRLLRGDKL